MREAPTTRGEVDVRAALVAETARLLDEGGPEAVSVRRLADAVGTSTMAVYTHFGGKPELLRAVCSEGFRQLGRRLDRVRPTDDPVADLLGCARAYRRAAHATPHLFRAMFSRPVTDVLVDPAEQAAALETFLVLVRTVERGMAAGRLTRGDADEVALELWSAVHGLVSIELGAGVQSARQAERALAGLVRHLAVGLGDDPGRAAASVPAPR